MNEDWRTRLLKAIDEDGRSDRAISLAANLGPNFVSQMRGTKSAAPKKPNIEYVQRLADVLGKDLTSIIGTDSAELRSALLAYGVPAKHLDRIIIMIDGFVQALSEELSERDGRRDQSEPASRPHESVPSGKRPRQPAS